MSILDEENIESDYSDNDEQYTKLLNSVSQLDSSQRIKPASRKEVSTEVSEYTLQKSTPDSKLVNVSELANVLRQKTKHVAITNKVSKVTGNSKTLPKPLEKTAEDKLKRVIGYENVKNQVQRWNAVVMRNKFKDQLTFPLKSSNMTLVDSSDFLKQFRTTTPLEAELDKVLKPDNVVKEQVDDPEFPLTLEEMLDKRKEMARLRAKLSYREAKAQRQNKIKSKKYHRILKREKLKQQIKEFEILQKTDPAKALEKLSELDKTRALERASLRHRNTGQWARNMSVQAKYDVQSRKILAEQLQMSRELTQKVQIENSSDEEENKLVEGITDEKTKNLIVSEDNPWALNVSKEVEEFVSGYKKFWSAKNKENDEIKMSKEGKMTKNESILDEFNSCIDKDGKVNEIDDGNKITSKSNEENKEKEANSNTKDVVVHQIDSAKDKMNLDNVNVSKKFKKENNNSNNSLENIKIRNVSVDINLKKDKFISSTDSLDTNKKIVAQKNEINNKNSSDKLRENEMVNNTTRKENILNLKQNKINPKSSLQKVKNKKNTSNKGEKIKLQNKSELASNKTNNNGLNKISMISVRPTSGMWLITSVDLPSDEKLVAKNDKKRKIENLNSLFDDLEEKISKKVSKKIKLIDKNLKKEVKKSTKKKIAVSEKELNDDKIKNSFRHSKDPLRPDLDVGLLEGSNEENLRGITEADVGNVDNLLNIEPEIDPKNFIKLKPKKLGIHVPEHIDTAEDEVDDETRQLRMIEVAFGEDDVLAEFTEIKEKEGNKTEIEISDKLPGWGKWGGEGIVPSERKKKRFKTVKLRTRKDKKKPDMIINEKENPNIREHLVKSVPYPFKNAEAFESHLRAPIGREWVPETAHCKLIQKPVETKLGTIIEPMDENEIIVKKKTSKSPYVGKKKYNKKS